MKILRAENGCQWDRAQTHQSIRENAVEEAYELVEAINNDDLDNMIEECGDLMLQSVFHCAIAEDGGEFNVEDVLSGICRKLIDRHTHIFATSWRTLPKKRSKRGTRRKPKKRNIRPFPIKSRR